MNIIEESKRALLMLSTHCMFEVESSDKDPKFKVDDHARISKNKNTFAKGYTSNWSKEVFVCY